MCWQEIEETFREAEELHEINIAFRGPLQ